MRLTPFAVWGGFERIQDQVANRVAGLGEGLSLARLPSTGPKPNVSSTLRTERFTLWLRGVDVVAAAAVLPLLHVGDMLVPMYVVVGAFGVYTLCIARFLIPYRPNWLAGGYLLFTADSAFLAAAIALTGGIQSAFAVIYLPLIVVHSMRYGAMHLLYAPMVSMVSLAAGVLAAGADLGDLARMAFWDFWIVTIALLSGVVVERGRRAEASLATELRRTRALLEAAHAPAASLTVEGVLLATISQARQLTESDLAAVHLYGGSRRPPAYCDEVDEGPGAEAFRHLVRGDFRARQALLGAARPMTPADLEAVRTNGKDLDHLSTLCAVAIPSRRGSQGFVAVARRSGPPLGHVEYEALSALLERAALAVQNARLYEQVQSQLQELRALHSSLIRADRLAAIGELAAKVAHELNNPLTSIMLYNSLLVEERASPAELQRISQRIVEEVERARRVIRNVLDYSRA
ncbi:MAG TPA: histidine kinase dimerization/phospho-acceptor domain-containing protein, partial [Chloroflexota bacterium]